MRINRLDLNQLACLHALLDECSVSRAAERVHLTQPAVSATLARMREFFGDPLLVQSGRRMSLTPFAASLIAPVRELLVQAQAITRLRPDGDLSQVQRQVTIVCSDYVLHVLLGPVLVRAEREAPGLRFQIRSIATYLEEELDRGDVDLVVSLATALMSKDHPQEEVCRDSFCCIAWEGNDRIGRTLSRSQFLAAGHVATLLGGGRVPTLDQIAMERLALSRRIEVHVPAFAMLPAAVVGTRRIATLQTQLAHQLCRHHPLKLLPCPVPIDPIVIAAQWHRHQSRDPALAWIRQALKEEAHRVMAGSGRGSGRRPARGLT